jgi:hypothetical protein
MKMFKGKNAVTVKMAAGAVILIILCMAVFVGLTQKAKATMSTDKVTASYTQGAESNLASALRDGYVKQNYTVANDYTDGMTKKDMSGEAAAEYGAQNLWRLFHVSLQNEKVHMTYTPANSAQTHALWFGQVNIGETMMYSFEVDAVTGANYYAFRWDYSKKHEYTNPLTNYDDFVALGVSTAKQFSLISGDNLTGNLFRRGQRARSEADW